MNTPFTGLVALAAASFLLSYFEATMGLMLGQLRLPLLVLWLGNPAVGAGTNLAVSAVGALAGCANHARRGNIDLRLFVFLALPSLASAYSVGRWLGSLSSIWPQLLIASVLIVSGLQLALSRRMTQTTVRRPSRSRLALEVLTGAICGALSGGVGLMMGTLRLASIVRMMGIEMRIAIGTNLAVGFVTAIAGSIGAWRSAGIDLPVLGVAGAATALGAWFGAGATNRIPPAFLNPMVGLTVFASGLLMLRQAVP